MTRGRLHRKRCVVCAKLTAGYAGYVYYQSGRTRMDAPFCKDHLSKASEYANPVFENPAAVEQFKQMFPVTYLQDVKGKPLLFFGTRITANFNHGC